MPIGARVFHSIVRRGGARSRLRSIMRTHPAAILMFVAAALFGAVGQYLYKTGAERTGSSIASYALNPRLLAGVACYLAVMVLFIGAFKKGGSLTVLYPVYASTFIFASVIAWAAYGTPIRPINVAGMALMIAAMYLMGRS
jgi:drug/metabolite transporter (DMT)-like permease